VRIGGGGRERVQHAHPRRDSRSCTVPARRYARHWGLLAACRTGGANRPGMSRPPQRWLGPASDLKVRPPGVVRSRLQTPRAGRRRNGGLAVTTRTALDREAPSRLIFARGSGPRVQSDVCADCVNLSAPGPRRPAPPSLSRRSRFPCLGRKTRRENASGRVKEIEMTRWASREYSPEKCNIMAR
jgi:hypothetical protein